MTHTERFLVVLLIVIALSVGSLAMAQSPGAEIDAKNGEQDAALAERALADGRQDAVLSELTAGQAALLARIQAIETALEAGQTPPTEPPSTNPDRPLLQAGMWKAAPFNLEEPYIDLIRASEARWSACGRDTDALYDAGVLDPRTGLPRDLGDCSAMTSHVYFSTGGMVGRRPHWAGDWVLEWETQDGPGDGVRADLEMLYLPAGVQRRVGANRLEFTRRPNDDHAAIRITRLDAPLTRLSLYRKEYEADRRAGRIYSPRFLALAEGYDIMRFLGLQEINRATVRRADQLAGMDAAFWGNAEIRAAARHRALSQPLEAVFRYGAESGQQVWMHAPPMLGSPVDLYAPDIYSDDPGRWLNNMSDAVKPVRAEIFASPEWDRYADKFVAALIASGYPEDRPLYVTVGNEEWNHAGDYNHSTRYTAALSEKGVRDGHGRKVARLKLALDAALARAGRAQAIVYVIEGQAANGASTRQAVEGAKAYLEEQGESWASHAPGFAASVSSYWGASAWDLSQARVDPNDTQALEDWFLNGPASPSGNRAGLLAAWERHAGDAAAEGVRFIGAYEGGPHFLKPKDMTAENYRAFVWGERGARINRAINDALAERFPGVILSNYALCGPTGGQPWFDAECGETTPLSESWDAYKRAGE